MLVKKLKNIWTATTHLFYMVVDKRVHIMLYSFLDSNVTVITLPYIFAGPLFVRMTGI